jgi:tetratricopeptide repeat protein/DUF2914 family protein
MTELDRACDLLARAEQAAMSGNFPSADELLKEAARVQEKELGPGHPDLANTLNNLAIIAEKTGRAAEAETLYRRSASIAAAALPPDHPMVVESRQNLADFCRAHGVPIDVPTRVPVDLPKPVTPPSKSDHEIAAVAPEVPLAPAPPKPPMAAAPNHTSRSPAWLAGAAVLLVALVLLVWRPWSSRETPTTVNPPEPKTEQPTESVPRPATAAPETSATRPKEPTKPVTQDRARQVTSPKPSAPGGITLAVAEVCRSFSTSGSNWRCDAVGSSAKPGPMVLYTRVKSPRDTSVVHRWYNGETLRQSVKLSIRGNATEGYRTYSRQTVSDGEWRVEVRSADNALLHEQRFVVR